MHSTHNVELPRSRPSVRFTAKELPELKSWEVGKTYALHVRVRQVSKEHEEKNPISARFQIVGVEAMHKGRTAAQQSMVEGMGADKYEKA